MFLHLGAEIYCFIVSRLKMTLVSSRQFYFLNKKSTGLFRSHWKSDILLFTYFRSSSPTSRPTSSFPATCQRTTPFWNTSSTPPWRTGCSRTGCSTPSSATTASSTSDATKSSWDLCQYLQTDRDEPLATQSITPTAMRDKKESRGAKPFSPTWITTQVLILLFKCPHLSPCERHKEFPTGLQSN